ncbi:MAG TPA: S41 family peptidase [Steroidobacteraceae bacterium]
MRWFGVVALAALAACGGGSGGGDNPAPSNPSPGGGIQWIPGVYQPASRFVAQCAAPRTGINPRTGRAYPDVQGSTLAENHWLRSWTHELYLWYDEVPDPDPAAYGTLEYFDLLKTSALTPSGNPKDRFHFWMPTEEFEQQSQSGISAGYGAQFAVLAPLPPRRVVVAYTEPGSPAAAANLQRGAEILTVDGVDVVNNGTQSGVNTINAGLFPERAGELHTFTVREVSGTVRQVTMLSANVVSDPVQNVSTFDTPLGRVGYMLFNDHIATAEAELINAVQALRAANISDLILDIRYNSGGYLDIASELAYMIAGPARTAGRTFERITFNAKHPSTNPVTGQPLQPVPFHSTTVGLPGALPAGQPLPALNLHRVFVLTGPATCSASEAIINGLRGIDVEVIQIGSTTCGKPYGFYPADNCGTTYFSIQFRGENDKSFGDYGDGFSPANTPPGFRGVEVPGCSVADDFSRPLGDPLEGLVTAALQYRETQTCPVPSGFSASRPQSTFAREGAPALQPPQRPWRENRILRPSD